MTEDEATLYLLLVVAVVAVIGVGFAAASFATNESLNRMMGGGGSMMGSPGTTTTASTPGGVEWSVLIVSAAFLVLAVVLLLRARKLRARSDSAPAPASSAGPVGGFALAPSPPQPDPPLPAAADAVAGPVASVPEPTLVKLLGDDEKRMYLALRDHGGTMYQRDIVALGTFSKAKVTRVLDKLEAKGLVVREAHGMTNRVRLVNLPAK